MANSRLIRPRLTRYLTQLLTSSSIVLISADAGTGKTTMITQFMEESKSSTQLLALTPATGNATSLFHALNSCFGTNLPEYDSYEAVESFIQRWSSRLEINTISQQIIAIDNVQYLDTTATKALALLLYAAPSQLCLICISDNAFADPLYKAGLDIQASLFEPAKLNFTSLEVKQLSQLNSWSISPDSRSRVISLTQGWPLGTSLLLEYINSSSGEHGITTLLNHRTKLHSWFSLCWQQYFSDTELQLLKQLAIMPIVDYPTLRYFPNYKRLHKLVSDLPLRTTLVSQNNQGQLILNPCLREYLLSLWYPAELRKECKQLLPILERQNLFEESMKICVMSENYHELIKLIDQIADSYVASNKEELLQNWIKKLPLDYDVYPAIQKAEALTLLATSPMKAERLLNQAYQGYLKEGKLDSCAIVWSLAIKALMGTWQSTPLANRWLERLHNDLEGADLSGYPSAELSLLTGTMGLSIYFLPFSFNSETWFRKAIEHTLDLSTPHNKALLCEYCFHYLMFLTEDFNQATTLNHRYSAAVNQTNTKQLIALITQAFLNAQTQLRLGNLALFEFHISELKKLQERSRFKILDSYTNAGPIYAALIRGKTSLAQLQLQAALKDTDLSIPMNFSHIKLLESWCNLEANQPQQALANVNLASAAADQRIPPFAHIHVLLIEALVLHETGNPTAATGSLIRAETINSGKKGELFIQISWVRAYFNFKQRNYESCQNYLRYIAKATQRNDICCHLTFVKRLYEPVLRYWINKNWYRDCWLRWLAPLSSEISPTPWLPEMQPIKVYLFDRFRIVINSEELTFGRKQPKKALTLLMTLLLNGGEANESDLAFEIWPDLDGDHARAALKTTLHRLRKLMGYQCIEVSGGKFRINNRWVWCDWISWLKNDHPAAFNSNSEMVLLPAEEDTSTLRNARRKLEQLMASNCE